MARSKCSIVWVVSQVFTVAPDRLTIGPKESATVVISGNTMVCGALSESFICKGGIGPGAKASRVLFEAYFKCKAAVPLLGFSEKELRFAYYYKKGRVMSTITKGVSIK